MRKTYIHKDIRGTTIDFHHIFQTEALLMRERLTVPNRPMTKNILDSSRVGHRHLLSVPDFLWKLEAMKGQKERPKKRID